MKPFAIGILASIAGVFAAPVAPVPAAAAEQVDKLTAAENEIYGDYVADARGRALYMFTPDKRGEGRAKAGSTCYGGCARAWPPVLAKDLPEVGGQLDKSLIGTTRRKDGSVQLTYGGWPLYYYIGDKGPGSVAGQDMQTHGGEWYLVSPEGSVIKKEQ